jgi:tryptophan synthase beta chain
MSGNQGKPPGRARPDTDDPFGRLAREAKAAGRGENAANAEVGDTSRLVSGDVDQGELLSSTNDILKLVNDSLAAAPDRADLWVMRFEVQKSLGLKGAFAEALLQAWNNPQVNKQIKWPLIRALWEDLAPGEPLPGGIKLADIGSLPKPNISGGGPSRPSTARNRRFADIAGQAAARELGVLAKAYTALRARPGFFEEFARKVAPMLARPTPLVVSDNLTRKAGGHARILLKREDRRRVTAEDENAAAQAYIAALLGKRVLITGNDVDAHSLALATMAPKFGMSCTIVLRPSDTVRNPDLVRKLRDLGTQFETWGGATQLRDDPREGALRLWQQSMGKAHLALSLGAGPAPYPSMISDFQSLLGRETELQSRAAAAGRARTLIASVTSDADSIGFMLPHLARQDVELIYAEPEPGGIASWRGAGRLRSYNGAVREHTWLHATGRIEHIAIGDSQALTLQQQLGSLDNIQIGLEDARALALTSLLVQRDTTPRDFVVLVA